MCIICLSFEKEKMTYNEALRAIRECSNDPTFFEEHMEDAIDFIDALEVARMNLNAEKG